MEQDAADAAATGGILLVDKPAGVTSHGVVARVRRLAGTRKVGHAGTLDPMATGLLVVGVGPATRLLTFVVGVGKGYRASVRLGWATDTDDADGAPRGPAAGAAGVSDAQVRDGLRRFVGEIDQVPSSVSAVKVAGRRAYDIVRSGGRVDLPARRVTIERIDVLQIRRGTAEPGAAGGAAGTPAGGAADAAGATRADSTPALEAAAARGEASPPGGGTPVLDVDIDVACSSGTYIRAIARDLGRALGTGGHLVALRRHTVGPFLVGEATGLAQLEAGGATGRILSPARAAGRLMPTLHLDADQARDLGHGKQVRLPAGTAAADRVAAVGPHGRLVGIAQVRDGLLRSITNFPPGPAGTGAAAEAKGQE